MNPLTAFPFRDMRVIAEMVSKEKIPVMSIQRATGMCYFDSTEASDMLAYLSTYGQVQETEEGWKRISTNKKAKYDRIRKKFLEDAEAILNGLTETPKTVEQISEEIKKSKETIELYLPFLRDITQFGVITRGPEQYQRTWHLVE